jgi:outer membrane lipoprotein carrier protein
MKTKFWAMLTVVVMLMKAGDSAAKDPIQPSASGESDPVLAKVLDGVEDRYLITGFSARFVQISTIKAMDISDTATGKLFVKPPGKMRWVYESPDPQIIVSDGENLWIYRPDDNQVMTGKSPSFFGDGRGAGFLSDIGMIRKKFKISLEKAEDPDVYMLKLIPDKNSLEIASIFLYVDKPHFNLVRITTYNAYDDETRVDFFDIEFDQSPNEELFKFVIPEGVDIFGIDEQ